MHVRSLIGFVSVIVCKFNRYKGLSVLGLTTCRVMAQDFGLNQPRTGPDRDLDQGLFESHSGG